MTLGPVAIVAGGRPVPLPRARTRGLLAVLSLNAGRLMSADALTDALWGGSPPDTARTQVQTGISMIRRLLAEAGAPDALTGGGAGYRLAVDPGQVDALVFERRVAAGRAAAGRAAGRDTGSGTGRGTGSDGDEAAARAELRAAVELWRGVPLADASGAFVESTRAGLTETYLLAMETLADLDLRAGGHAALIPVLVPLVEAHPFRESLRARLMTALHRGGRSAEALAGFRRYRRLLADREGLDPGPELLTLETRILRGEDPATTTRPMDAGHARRPEGPRHPEDTGHPGHPEGAGHAEYAGDAGGAAGRRAGGYGADAAQTWAPPVPRQLPADLRDFTARTAEISVLTELLGSARGEHAPAAAAIVGTGGVGKTSLAVRIGHMLRDVYPDGQLFIDLLGVEKRPLPPREALARFLRALGVPGQAIPDSLDERAELYRSTMAARAMLVVLDNAAASGQLPWLTPGGSGCGVLVTSRAHPRDLPGVPVVRLNVLEPDDAVRLLAAVSGRGSDARDAAAYTLADTCGRLPLALRIAGARLAAKPHWGLSDLARRLGDGTRRLDELDWGGEAVRANLAVGYHGLDPVSARLLRRAGSLAARRFQAWTAAALLDADLGTAEDAIERLIDAQLVAAEHSGEYTLVHDLVRLFAAERAAAEDSPGDLPAALERVCGGWLTLLDATLTHEYGGRFGVLRGDAARWWPVGAEPPETDVSDLDALRPPLVDTILQAAELGITGPCWELAHGSIVLFEARVHFDDWRATHEAALAALAGTGDLRGEAALTISLAGLYAYKRHWDRVTELGERAAELAERLGDRHARGLALNHLATADWAEERLGRARERFLRARQELIAAGDRFAEVAVLRGLAHVHAAEKDVGAARAVLGDALAIAGRLGSHRGQAHVFYQLGRLEMAEGSPERAEVVFKDGLRIIHHLGDDVGHALIRLGFGEALAACGRWAEAIAELGEAVAVARLVGLPFILGQVLTGAGRVHLTAGNQEAGIAHLTEARAIYRAIAYETGVARVEAALSAV